MKARSGRQRSRRQFLAGAGSFALAAAAAGPARAAMGPDDKFDLVVMDEASQATEPLFSGSQAPHELGKWLGLLALYDMVFVLVSIAVFDFLLED